MSEECPKKKKKDPIYTVDARKKLHDERMDK